MLPRPAARIRKEDGSKHLVRGETDVNHLSDANEALWTQQLHNNKIQAQKHHLQQSISEEKDQNSSIIWRKEDRVSRYEVSGRLGLKATVLSFSPVLCLLAWNAKTTPEPNPAYSPSYQTKHT
jgi:hypothetical protein